MKVHIRNFKSIQNVEEEFRRVNILIGPSNSGKSNLLEAFFVYGIPHVVYELKRAGKGLWPARIYGIINSCARVSKPDHFEGYVLLLESTE